MEKKSPKRVTDAKEKTKEIINKEIGRKANKKNQTKTEVHPKERRKEN